MKRLFLAFALTLCGASAFAQVPGKFGGEVKATYLEKGGGVSASTGFAFWDKLYVGVGTGAYDIDNVCYANGDQSVLIPTFAQVRYDILSGNVVPMLDAKVGFASDYTGRGTGWFLTLSAGLRFGNIGVSAGYNNSNLTYQDMGRQFDGLTIGLSTFF